MHRIRPLPEYLVRRFHGWRATTYEDNKGWYRKLAKEGQTPRAMMIACCDSRVNVMSLFEADQGDFFVHRNIANLVPPYEPGSGNHGTSAAIEYAVNVLKVSHLIVMGHTHCGGVKGCYDMCSGHAPKLEEKTSFVGRWMDILRPGYDRLPEGPDDVRIDALEREGVLVSLENLLTFPFVRDAVESGDLSLHGLLHHIGEGTIDAYDRSSGKFVPI